MFDGLVRALSEIIDFKRKANEDKKTVLEISKLQEDERQKLIIPATLEQVKKYDPKIRNIEKRLHGDSLSESDRPSTRDWDTSNTDSDTSKRLIPVAIFLVIVVHIILFLVLVLLGDWRR